MQWVNVPLEPTPEMIEAGEQADDLNLAEPPYYAAKSIYAAMLAASPTQPLTEIEVAVGWKGSVTCTASLGSRAQAFEEGVRFAEKHFGITAQEPTK
jgi:hypothetical protein